MKFLSFFVLLIIVSRAEANCTVRVSIDPIFSRNFSEEISKVLESKKYKVLTNLNEKWEQFHLNIKSHGEAPEILVELNKFVSTSFTAIYNRKRPAGLETPESLVRGHLADLPSCNQAMYAEVFDSLKD